jgi:hydroxymethylglutaryl-CoA reductase
MRQRGGGILDIELRDKTNLIDHYFQLHATFGTGDSMGKPISSIRLSSFQNAQSRSARLRCL